MLNTESRVTASLVWLVIAALGVTFAWTWFAVPPPAQAYAALARSTFTDWLMRNQVMVTGLAGFGAVALAYLYNGWRNRVASRTSLEQAEKRLAGVAAREAGALATSLEEAGRALTQGRFTGHQRANVIETATGQDRLLLGAPMASLAHLGAGAVASIGNVRQSLRRLGRIVEGGEETSERHLAEAVASALEAARAAEAVLGTHERKGPSAADRLRVLPTNLSHGLALEVQPAPRLLPAA